MIVDKHAVPLSPPTSPHMSDTHAKLNDYSWQPAQDALLERVASLQQPVFPEEQSTEPLSNIEPQSTEQSCGNATPRPPLRSHRSFPYSLGPSSRASDDLFQQTDSVDALGEFKERVVSQGSQPTGISALPQSSFGGSAPTSPVGRLTPNSPNAGQHEAQMEDDDLELEDAEPDEEGERRPKTAAELRAQKRKMKRFRLTHNQTRFLMSEFARQAHPDAAHRERLSREIPGLSPRQVQVWFQNRRAKLKRLTTDDRESMMRSRALPAGFDMTQALHSPFRAQTPAGSTSAVQSQTFAPFGNNNAPIPLTLDTMRRSSHYQPYAGQYTSPTGVTPATGHFAFTPPQSATETLSPASAIGGANAYNFQPHESPRRPSYGMQNSAQVGYGSHASHASQVPRIHTHDRFARPAPEAVGSPLRTSMSYSGLNANNVSQQQGERSNSFSGDSSYTHESARQSRSNSNLGSNSAGPYGLGFSYAQMPTYNVTGQTPQTTTAASTPHLPATLDQYRRNTPQVASSPVSYAPFAQSSFAATSQMPQYSYYSTVYGGGGSDPSYANYHQQISNEQQGQRMSMGQGGTQQQQQQQQQQHQQHGYSPIGTQAGHYEGLMRSALQPQDPGDNSDGGVPVGTTF